MPETSRISPNQFIAITQIHKEAIELMQESLPSPSPYLALVIRYFDGTIKKMREIQNEEK